MKFHSDSFDESKVMVQSNTVGQSNVYMFHCPLYVYVYKKTPPTTGPGWPGGPCGPGEPIDPYKK